MKQVLLKTWLILACLLVLGGGRVWAETYTGTFTKITSASDLTTGYYVVAASENASSNANYAMGSTISSKRVTGVSITISNGTTITNPDKTIVWYIEKNGTNYTFKNVSLNQYLTQSSTTSGGGMGFAATSSNFTLAAYNSSSPIGFRFNLNQSSNYYLKYNASSKWFANYANDYTTSMTPVRLFKLNDTKYKVSFDAGTGSCSTTSITETAPAAGVTLPSCIPATGYQFDGWSRAQGSEVADAGKAGDTFRPTSNCTLYAVYDVEGTIKVNKTTFSTGETSGNLDEKISYASEKGDGTNAPAINSSKLRLYKPASGKSEGCYVTITATEGYKITSVKLTFGKDGSMKHSVDGGTLSESTNVSETTPYIVSNIFAPSVSFFNVGSDSEDIATIEVKYREDSSPRINANDVNIAYNTTSGSIPYTIANEDGSTLVPSTEATWISNLVANGTAVTFNCTANPNDEVREGVITLTYGSVEKEITVSQAAAPYTISALAPVGGSYTVKVGSDEAVNVTSATDFDVLKATTITLHSEATSGYKLASTPFTVTGADDSNISVSKSGDNYTFTMPTQNVTVTANFSRVYTITKGVCENGVINTITDTEGNPITETSTRSTVKVTATADEHYHLLGMYYVREGEETKNVITETEGVYSFSMVSSNVTVYAEFEEDTKYAVSWMVNGVEAKHEEVYNDVAISAPAVESIAGKVFRGWVEDEINTPQNETPSYVNVSGLMVDEDKTFHAVFATASGNASTDYSKITSMASLTDNDYVIAYDYNGGTQIAMGNTANGTTKINASALSLSDSKYANPDADYIWSIKKVSDGVYTLYNADADKYAKAISSGASLVDDPYNFTITWDNTNSCFRIQSTTNTTYYLHGYVSGTTYEFQSSTSGNGAKYHMHLYKSESTVSYSDFTTFVGHTRNVTDGNYGTICLPCATTSVEGATIYNIAGKTENGIVLTEEEGNLVAGTPYIFKATASQIVATYIGAAVNDPVSATGLVGNLSADALNVPQGSYVLSNNQLRKVNGGTATVGQNRAYIDLSGVGEYNPAASAKKAVFFGFDGSLDEDYTTGISTIETINNEAIYNLQGQRINRIQQGVNIVNGRKVIR